MKPTKMDRLAFWWLRRRYPRGVTVMETPGLQRTVQRYKQLSGPKRS